VFGPQLGDNLDMLETHRLLLASSQQLRSLNDVLDLSSVQLEFRETVDLVANKVVIVLRTVDKRQPDLSAGLETKITIVKRNMDSALENGIHILYTIASEERKSFVVLQNSEED
jgi:hypothetical protein